MSLGREREINELSIVPITSNRPNIKYSVISVQNSIMISNKKTLIASNPLPNEADRGIIYSPTKKLAEIFSKAKGAFSTTAFGMGLNYRSVRCVFHAGQSYSMGDYRQLSRSRDGKKGHAICVAGFR